MHHHSWTQIPASFREDAKDESERGNDDRRSRSLINMSRTEQHRGEQDAERNAAEPRDKLPLQVPPKDSFFADSRRRRESNPNDGFQRALGRKAPCDFQRSGSVKKPGHCAENDEGDNPRAKSDGDVTKKIHRRLPAFAGDVAKRFSVAAHSPIHVTEYGPLPSNRR